MKIIKEHISFERGREPKGAMEVGLSSKYGPKTSLFLKIHDFCKRFLQQEIKTHNIKVSEIDYVNIEPMFTLELDPIDNGQDEKYTFYLTKEEGIIMFEDWVSGKNEVEIPSIDYLIEILTAKSVSESVSFERGKDPKKSMDVGLGNKYGKLYDLFILCHNLSLNSESFEWVSDIVHNEGEDPFFNIESLFYYTDENDNKIPEQFVVTLSKDCIDLKNITTQDEYIILKLKRFLSLTTAYEEESIAELSSYFEKSY